MSLSDDKKYKDIDMDSMSLPEYRDGVVLVDVKEKVVRWGLNGETHAELLFKHYNIPEDSEDLDYEIDDYVASGIYLKDFLGQESIIMYNEVIGVDDVVKSENPNIIIYHEDILEEVLLRTAFKRK